MNVLITALAAGRSMAIAAGSGLPSPTLLADGAIPYREFYLPEDRELVTTLPVRSLRPGDLAFTDHVIDSEPGNVPDSLTMLTTLSGLTLVGLVTWKHKASRSVRRARRGRVKIERRLMA